MNDARALTAYFGERKRVGGRFAADVLLDLFERHAVENSVLYRGIEGFGLRHHLRTDSTLTLSEDLPAVAVAVDRRARIDALLPDVAGLPGVGLVTVERVRVPTDLAAVDLADAAVKLSVTFGRHDRIGRVPAFVAVCDMLHAAGVAGATALLGVDGTVRARRERARFVHGNAAVPMTVVAVAAAGQLAGALPDLGAMRPAPVLTVERVQLCKRDGVLLAKPRGVPGTDEHGLALWQKLTIYSSETAQHAGRPLHRALTRRLRAAGASGATSLRGVRGYSGDHRPHGDRLWQFGRRVPTVTTVIDRPDRATRWFDVIDELTAESGLVTSEVVPALRASAGAEVRGGLRLARRLP